MESDSSEKVRRGEPITKLQLKDGRFRYRVIVDGGVKPDGKRRQLKRTFATKKEAASWLSKTRVEVDNGAFVERSRTTVRGYLDSWLAGREGIRENTRAGYRDALEPIYREFGDLQLQALTSEMLLRLKQTMRTTGGRKNKGYAPRSIELMLTLLGAALESAKDGQILQVNVASVRRVERPRGSSFQGKAWTEDETRTFVEYVSGHRLEAAWRISLCGLRRSEVLGLRWSDIDLAAGLLTVRRSRTPRKGEIIGGETTVVDDPKRPKSFRTIPLPLGVLASVKAFKVLQQQERLRVGRTLGPDNYVVVDQLGTPIHPDTYSRWFKRVVAATGLPNISLHDARRTAATLLSTHYGVPADAAAAYLGHDPVTYHRVYVQGEHGYQAVANALDRLSTGTDGR